MRGTGVRRTMLAATGVTTAALGTFLVVAPSAAADSGHGGDSQRIRILDDCEAVSFTKAGIPCEGDGETTAEDFGAQLIDSGKLVANETVDGWEFKPGTVHIDHGDRLHAVNLGGEFHTFTEVAKYGGGCVEDLNLGAPPVDECPDDPNDPTIFITTGVPAGASLDVVGLDVGKHRFECLIHPWMRTTVTVRGGDHSGHG